MKVTPDHIDSLKPNEVFVFGSNLSGLHYGGAARVALQWGAQMHNPEGLQGQTYALPTVQKEIAGPLPYDEVQKHVTTFIMFAGLHPNLNFLVTPVGCGLAGLDVMKIAPMFEPCMTMDNVALPSMFLKVINGLPGKSV